MDVPTQVELCSDTKLLVEWEASNFLARWLAILVSLLFIEIPTFFLIFFKNFSLFTVYCTIRLHLSALKLET